MKKFVAILLTLMLVLGIGAAVAAGPNLTDAKLTKVYTEQGGTAPADTFKFTAVYTGNEDGATGAGPALTIADVAATAAGVYNTALITPADAFPSVGKYYYTVKETAGTVAGIAYDASELYLMVLVTTDDAGTLIPSYYLYTDSNKTVKKDGFTNAYTAGSLKVTKTVTGNLGDKKKEFDFNVTFTKPEGKSWDMNGIVLPDGATKVSDGVYSFKLKHGATAEFKNLPYDVTYTVTETAADGYTTTVGNVETNVATGSIKADVTTVAFTNYKNGEIDTGVTTENLPYILLIGFVVLAGAALLIKRKAHNN